MELEGSLSIDPMSSSPPEEAQLFSCCLYCVTEAERRKNGGFAAQIVDGKMVEDSNNAESIPNVTNFIITICI